jgi:hypothetical protein
VDSSSAKALGATVRLMATTASRLKPAEEREKRMVGRSGPQSGLQAHGAGRKVKRLGLGATPPNAACWPLSAQAGQSSGKGPALQPLLAEVGCAGQEDNVHHVAAAPASQQGVQARWMGGLTRIMGQKNIFVGWLGGPTKKEAGVRGVRGHLCSA